MSKSSLQMHLRFDEVWDYFDQNRKRLAVEQVLIAENLYTGNTLYLTESAGCPCFYVYSAAGTLLYHDCAVSAGSCFDTVRSLFTKYMMPLCTVTGDPKKPQKNSSTAGQVKEVDEDTMAELDDAIYERDEALIRAMTDALLVFLNVPDVDILINNYGEDVIDGAIEGLCSYLANVEKISVYRPMWEFDKKTGMEVYSEYPYLEIPDIPKTAPSNYYRSRT